MDKANDYKQPISTWLRRLEGETPEDKYFLFVALRGGPSAAAEIIEERVGVSVKNYTVPSYSCSRMSLFAELIDFNTKVNTGIVHQCMQDVLSDSITRSDALVQSVIDAYYILNNSALSTDTIMNISVGYFYLDLFGQLEEWFKFQTTYLSAQLLKQVELPKIPDFIHKPGYVCGGAFYRRVRQLLLKDKLTHDVVAWSMTILGLKRGAMPLRSEQVEKSLTKHLQTLSKPALPIDGNFRRSLVRECMEEVIDTSLDGAKSASLKMRMPSGSSHWGWTRAEGGAVGRISQLARERYGLFANQRTTLAGFAEFRPGKEPLPIYVPSYTDNLVNMIIDAATSETLDCDVHVVLEPMKARIITSGPPLRYHLCRMIQKVIHNQLRQEHAFSLIGGPVTEELLEKNFSSLHRYQTNWTLVSADYSAATDNINGQLSQEYLKMVSTKLDLPVELRTIFEDSMVGHVLHYPQEFGGDTCYQETGQLMGSPTSFPGLCIINLATLYAAWKAYCIDVYLCRTSYQQFLRDLRPLVNGDDLLFLGPPDFVKVWRTYVEAVGLQPSPGKNYVSDEFCVINSTAFLISKRYEPSQRDCGQFRIPTWSHNFGIERVHWVGSGLLKGQARVLSDTRTPGKGTKGQVEDQVDFGQLRSQLAWVLDWTGKDKLDRMERSKEVWFRNMRDVLKKQSRSWCLPVALGGLGLPFGSATRPQLVLANMIVKTWDIGLSSQIQPKTRAKMTTTVLQLKFEKEMAQYGGAQRYVREYLPYEVIRSPCVDDEMVQDDEGNIYLDPARRQMGIQRIVSPKILDISVSPFFVGLDDTIISDPHERLCDFEQIMSRACEKWKGGPMKLEEALLWNGTTCVAGGSCTLPEVNFVPIHLRTGTSKDESDLVRSPWGEAPDYWDAPDEGQELWDLENEGDGLSPVV